MTAGVGPGPQRDVRNRDFPGMGVGCTDGRSGCYGAMREQRVLDQGRVDVVAAANDEVFGTTGEVTNPS